LRKIRERYVLRRLIKLVLTLIHPDDEEREEIKFIFNYTIHFTSNKILLEISKERLTYLTTPNWHQLVLSSTRFLIAI